MGEVWLAEQTEPVHRRVALKIIKLGMDTKQVLARLEAERQALAVMDHPNIASFYDGGATESGRPYFVMELVQGVPVTDYCDTNRLTTDERIRLFVDLCQAVQHAHHKGVVHRDLKPTNVLVTVKDKRPVVKIIDFGIAKALSQELTERTLVTRVGQIIGTPEYMSPEQAEMSGLDVDTRTDVYSLGVMLYELLVGALPFDLGTKADQAIRHAIRETEVPRPSTRLTSLGDTQETISQHRRTTAEALKKELKTDLDWIILKAMEKDRTRRYDTANGLALELERHLRHEPVLARGPSTGYRVGKFVKRHRVGVVFSAVLTLLLLGFAATMTVQAGVIAKERDRAQQEAEKANAVVGFLQDMLSSANPLGAAHELQVVDALGRAAEGVDAAFVTQPEVKAAVQSTIGMTYHGLGLYDDAKPHLLAALKAHRSMHPEGHVELAASMDNVATLMRARGQFTEAEPLIREALAMRIAVLGEDHVDVAESMNSLGELLLMTAAGDEPRADESERMFRRSLEIRRTLLGDLHMDVASSLNNLALVLHHLKGDLDQAETLLREALAINEEVLGPDHTEVGTNCNALGLVLRDKGEYAEAEEHLQRALAITRDNLGEEHLYVAISLDNIGRLVYAAGDAERATEYHRQAIEDFTRLFGEDNWQVAQARASLGDCLTAMTQYPEAEQHLLAAHGSLVTGLGSDHYRTRRAVTSLVALYEGWGRPGQADEWRERAQEVGEPG